MDQQQAKLEKLQESYQKKKEEEKEKALLPHLFFTPVHAHVHLTFLQLDGIG